MFLFELTLASYFIATIVAIRELFLNNKILKDLSILIKIGFILHTGNLVWRFFISGHIPTANMHEALLFFSWCILILFFYFNYKYKIKLLGSFIIPMVFLLMLFSYLFPKDFTPLKPILRSYWLCIHTVFAFIGDAAFAMAASVGFMFLLQEHFLKSKKICNLFYKLPSLQILDNINYQLISIGVPFLSLAIITGAIWAESALGSYWRWDPKEVWALITWLIYVVILHARITAGWKGRKTAYLSLVGFSAVLFTFLGVNLIFKKGFHAAFLR